MNISERIFNSQNKKSYLGVAPINSLFDPVAVYVVDYGADQSSYCEILSINERFLLHIRDLSGDSFQYIVHGSYVLRKANLEEVQRRVQKEKGESLTIDDLFSKEIDPLFRDAHQASSVDHDRFQEALERNGLWLLLVKSSTDTYIFVERGTGNVAKISETSRQEFAILDPENFS